MTTLQDVAKRAGVSTATVSKVLSNTPYFTAKTRDKVMRAVDELGYVPNLAARALSTGKTNVIAVVFPYVYDGIFKDPLVMHILEGIESECTQTDYNILLSTPRLTEEGVAPQFNQLLSSGYIDGVIAIDNVPLASVGDAAIKKNIPTVVIGYTENDYFVYSDDYGGGQQLMEHVLALGHKDIAIITVPDSMNHAIERRIDGIKSVLDKHGIDFDALPCELGDFSTAGGAKAMQNILSQNAKVTAVVCLNDRMAIGAIQQIYQAGLHVPDDITVVGYDNIASSEIATPPLTTIDQQAVELGREATKMLIDVLGDNCPEAKVLPTHLIVRESSAKPRH